MQTDQSTAYLLHLAHTPRKQYSPAWYLPGKLGTTLTVQSLYTYNLFKAIILYTYSFLVVVAVAFTYSKCKPANLKLGYLSRLAFRTDTPETAAACSLLAPAPLAPGPTLGLSHVALSVMLCLQELMSTINFVFPSLSCVSFSHAPD